MSVPVSVHIGGVTPETHPNCDSPPGPGDPGDPGDPGPEGSFIF